MFRFEVITTYVTGDQSWSCLEFAREPSAEEFFRALALEIGGEEGVRKVSVCQLGCVSAKEVVPFLLTNHGKLFPPWSDYL